MRKLTLLAALWSGLAFLATAQQVKPTSSGSNTGSPQAGNSKPVASANPGGSGRSGQSARGQAANANTTNATGTNQGGTHNGVQNPGSTARPHVHAANAQKTDRPASGGDAGQGTPGAHSKRKAEDRKPTGGTGGPKR